MQGGEEGQGDASAEPATFWLCIASWLKIPVPAASCTLAWCHTLLCPLGVSDTCTQPCHRSLL